MRYRPSFVSSILITITLAAAPASATNYTWTGGGGDDAWDNAANWNPAGVPGDGDNALIVSAGVTYGSGTTLLGDLALGNGATLTVRGGVFGFSGTGAVDSTSSLVLDSSSADLQVGGALNVQGGLEIRQGDLLGSGSVAIQSGGTLSLASASSATVNGPSIQLDGTGTAGPNYLTLAGGTTVTVGSGGTLSLTGSYLVPGAGGGGSVVNEGTVRRPASLGTYHWRVPLTSSGTWDIQSGDFYVEGSFTAESSGTLQVASGARMMVSAATLRLSGGTLAGNGTITGINAPTYELTADMTVPAGFTLEVASNGTMTGTATLTVEGTLGLLGGTIRNSGGVTVASGGGMIVANTDTVDGIAVTNHGVVRQTAGTLHLANGAVLTNASDGEVELAGSSIDVSAGTASVVNEGWIERSAKRADYWWKVPLTSRGTFVIRSSNFYFSTPGGTVEIAAGTLGVESGVTAVVSQGTLRFSGGALTGQGTITGINAPTYDLAADRTVPSGFNRVVSSNGTMAGSGELTVDGTFSLLGGTIRNTGGVTVASGATMAVDNTDTIDGAAVTNHGMIRQTGGTLHLANGAVLSNASDGRMELTAYSIDVSEGSASVVNDGTIERPAGNGTYWWKVPTTNRGTFDIQSGDFYLYPTGGVVDLAAGVLRVAPGIRAIVSGSTLRFSGGALAGTGTITGVNAPTFDLTADLTVPSGFTLEVATNGSLTGSGALTVEGLLACPYGALESTGGIGVSSGGEVALGSCRLLGVELDNSGSVRHTDSSLTFGDGATLTNGAGGTLELASGGTIASGTGGGSIVNHGTLRRTTNAAVEECQVPVENDGTLLVETGGLRFRAGLTNHAGGVLAGNGILDVPAPAVFVQDGVVSPGLSPGLLSFGSTPLPSAASSEWRIEIGGTAEDEIDRITTDGGIALDGTLTVSLPGGFTPRLRQKFTIATADSVSGAFATVTGDSPGYCLGWDAYGAEGKVRALAVSQGPLLSVRSWRDAEPVTVGETATVTAAVTNSGPVEATGTVLTFTLPSELSFDSANPSQGSCTESGGTVECALGTLPVGRTATVTVQATADAEATVSVPVTRRFVRGEPPPGDGVGLRRRRLGWGLARRPSRDGGRHLRGNRAGEPRLHAVRRRGREGPGGDHRRLLPLSPPPARERWPAGTVPFRKWRNETA